jgi:hypothetical protein
MMALEKLDRDLFGEIAAHDTFHGQLGPERDLVLHAQGFKQLRFGNRLALDRMSPRRPPFSC